MINGSPLFSTYLPRFSATRVEACMTCLLPSGEFVTPTSAVTETSQPAANPVFSVPRIFLPPPVRVYSDPDLIPADETEKRTVLMRHDALSTFHRDALVDLRDVRFIHSLSEGRAGALVSEKVALMRMRLAVWRGEGSSETDPVPLLSFLTKGNKSGTRDQIMVGRLKDEGDFYLLNGHRRIAALCVLAASGDIPKAWLARLPVWLHEIADSDAVAAITAGTALNSEQVLAEIVCDGVRAALALRLLERMPRRRAVVSPLPLPRRMHLTSSDHRLFLDLAERGGVDASLSEVLLKDLTWMADKTAQHPTDYAPFIDRLERRPYLHGEVLKIVSTSWPLFRELAVPLHRSNPQGVRRHLHKLLSEAPMTRTVLAEIHIVAKRLKETEILADLKRFRDDPDALVRAFALSQPLGDTTDRHEAILRNAARSETDHYVLDRVELTLQSMLDSRTP